jgi:chromosome segregation ATPase
VEFSQQLIYVIQISGGFLQVKEAQEEVSALKTGHNIQIKELFEKTCVIEEENTSLKEEALKLNQERATLIEEKDSLSLEKRDLDIALSKSNSNLSEISARIDEAEKLASSEKSKVRMTDFCCAFPSGNL